MTHKKLLERNRKITDALQNGAKVTDLAQEHGLSPQTVYHIAQAEMEKRRKVTFTDSQPVSGRYFCRRTGKSF